MVCINGCFAVLVAAAVDDVVAGVASAFCLTVAEGRRDVRAWRAG